MTRPKLRLTNAIWQDDTRLYVYAEQDYRAVREQLVKVGYRVAYDTQGDTEAEAGNIVYTLFIPDVARVKCKQCGALSAINGAQVHGKQCSGCKEVIYRDIYPGALVNFTFESTWINGPYVWQKVTRWDENKGYLYCASGLSPEIDMSNHIVTVTLLNSNRASWRLARGDGGERVLCYLYFGRGNAKNAIHNLHCASDPEVGYDNILYWNGVEYPEDSDDPILPNVVKVFKKW